MGPLRRAAHVAVVKSADLGERNDAAAVGQLDRAWLGRVLLECRIEFWPTTGARVAVDCLAAL